MLLDDRSASLPRPALTKPAILAWADAHYRRFGRWPAARSGPVFDAPGENWSAIDTALREGFRGLPGGSSLSRLLLKQRGVRQGHVRNRTALSIDRILEWADRHLDRNGEYPNVWSGTVADVPGENWSALDQALKKGNGGLSGGQTLARLLDEHRRVRAWRPRFEPRSEQGIEPQLRPVEPAMRVEGKPVRQYAPEQIHDIFAALEAGREQGRTEQDVLADLGVTEAAVRTWRRDYGRNWLDAIRRCFEQRKELRALQKELDAVKNDLTILDAAFQFIAAGSHAKRRCVDHACRELGVPAGSACRVLRQPQSTVRNPPRARSDQTLAKRVKELSKKHPKYGIPKIRVLLEQEGWQVTRNMVATIRRREGLQAQDPSESKRRRHGLNSCSVLPAARPNDVWSYDFIHHRTADGRAYRILTVLDEFTRECLAVAVAARLSSSDVVRVLRELFVRRGVPRAIRADNGRELVAQAVRRKLAEGRIDALFVTKASPWENNLINGFHRYLRAELLDEVRPMSVGEARVLIERWNREYNEVRPHSALGYMTPAAFAASGFADIRAGEAADSPPPFEERELRSTWLKGIGYNRERSVLQIRFAGGQVFRYFGVPAERFDGLLHARRPGRYFREHFMAKRGGLSEGSCRDSAKTEQP